eukprot:gene12621-10436_t
MGVFNGMNWPAFYARMQRRAGRRDWDKMSDAGDGGDGAGGAGTPGGGNGSARRRASL